MQKHVRGTMSGMMLIPCLLGFVSVAKGAETVVYSEGFEGSNGGYSLAYGTNAGWGWGSPTGSVGPGSAHSGTKCWGTNLSGPIPRPCDASIVSPAIALPAITADQLIRVRFWAFVSLDGMYDRGQFFVSSDGVTWESLSQFYNNMETDPSTVPQWRKYEFTLSPTYAGKSLYLRFRTAVQSSYPTFYCGGSSDLSGFYIDDVAVTIYNNPGAQKIFTMEASEDPSAWASCPWVAPWNGTEFATDNDIYSVARGADAEYTDQYRIMKPLVARNGVYPIQIQELETETSYTDFAALLQVDHAADVAVAPDEKGNLVAYRPDALLAPQSAVDGNGANVLALVATSNNDGYSAYSGDTVVLGFGTSDISAGAALVLRVKGFVLGSGAERPYTDAPAVVVETLDGNGQWQERARMKPRFDFAVDAFELASYFVNGQPVVVRLRALSHSVKYHLIDSVGLRAGAAPVITTTAVAATKAAFGAQDVLPQLRADDGDRFKLSSGESLLLEFPAMPLATGNVRDFVFVSKGYYLPTGGSYLVSTWDGNTWVLRDAYNYPGSDLARSFDLSMFLPDPTGQYRVRVWQDYQYESAGIDQVLLGVGGVNAPLNYAWDYRTGSSIFDAVLKSDNVKASWSGCPRNRVTEYRFTGPTNTPPTTNPVTVTSNLMISWTYADAEGNPQSDAEVQIWTGPGQTGNNVWNPPAYSGTGTSVVYNGPALPSGTYYVIVRAKDGTDWGAWSETTLNIAQKPTPPTCALTAVIAGPPKQMKVTVQDPDNGLKSVEVTEANNATVALPTFTAGDKSAMFVVATKVDQSKGASFALRVTDVNGAVTNCDPVVPGEPDATGDATMGCNVTRGKSGLGIASLIGSALVGLALLRRRQRRA